MNKRINKTFKKKRNFTKKRKNYKKKSRKLRQKSKGGSDTIIPNIPCDTEEDVNKYYEKNTLKPGINIQWPSNSGCDEGTKQIVIIKKDTVIDRFGGESGFYFCIAGKKEVKNIDYSPNSYSSRALPYSHETDDFDNETKNHYINNTNLRHYHLYYLFQDILAIRCKIKKAYCGVGGAYQYLAINFDIFNKINNKTITTHCIDDIINNNDISTQCKPLNALYKNIENKFETSKIRKNEEEFTASIYNSILKLKNKKYITEINKSKNKSLIIEKLKYNGLANNEEHEPQIKILKISIADNIDKFKDESENTIVEKYNNETLELEDIQLPDETENLNNELEGIVEDIKYEIRNQEQEKDDVVEVEQEKDNVVEEEVE